MIEFFAERPIWSNRVTLYGRRASPSGWDAIVADGIKFVPIEEGMLPPPFINIATINEDAQSLFDALWRCGFRPNNGEASASHVEAIKGHLEDMRTIVFKDFPK